MSRKQKNKKNIKPRKKANASTKTKVIEEPQNKTYKIKLWVPISIILLLTTIVYSYSFQNDFIINWDDAGYIIKSKYVKSIDGETLKAIFSDFYMSNYHPITTLTYAIEYSIVGENPFLYHFNNFILHLLNTILVFFLIKALIKKGSLWIPFIVSLFFAIHPMHVESVAWISERKDVLYSFFFLLSLIFYLKYLRKGKLKFYFLLFIFFVLSLMSKSAAVVLPVLLLAFDWFESRKWSWWIIIEKIPLFGMSMWFGLMAISSQEEAMQNLTPMLSIIERLLIVNYSFITYLWKLFLPIHLSAMYPYPLKENDLLPQIYYIIPAATAIIAFLVWKFRKERVLLFGIAFFIITIALVIQLLPVGGTIISERYSYIPYIGLLIPIAVFLDRAFKNNKKVLGAIVVLITILLALQSFNRIKYWKNGDVLFTDVIKKYPKLPYAYNNRGFLYWDHYALNVFSNNPQKKEAYIKKAYQDYTMALSLDPNYVLAWSNRAILLYNTGKTEDALQDFNMVLSIDSMYTDGLIGRANTLSTLERFEESLNDYNVYLKLKPKDDKAYMWRGIAYSRINKNDLALADLRLSVELAPSNHEPWFRMGICYYNLGQIDSAIYFFDQSISKKQDFYDVYAWKALSLNSQKKYEEALTVFEKAISINPDDPVNYVNRATSLYNLNRYDEAMKDLQTAGNMGFPLNREFFMAVQNKNPYLQGKI